VLRVSCLVKDQAPGIFNEAKRLLTKVRQECMIVPTNDRKIIDLVSYAGGKGYEAKMAESLHS